MSANPVARPHSRRGLLTAALAGTAASAATLGGHVVLAAVTEPDPIFAAIARERAAWRSALAASDVYCDADDAFRRSGFRRQPRALIGEWVQLVRRDQTGAIVYIPEHEQAWKPVYAHTHNDIDRDCDASARAEAHDTEARRQRLHAELDADAEAIRVARQPEEEAKRLSEEAHRAWRAEAAVMVEVTPTTIPGLLALLDRFEEHTDDIDVGEDEDGVKQLVRNVRRLLTEARA